MSIFRTIAMFIYLFGYMIVHYGGANDNGLDDLALLDLTAGGSLTHGRDDDIADVAVLAAGATENADALDFLGAGIIGNLQIRL